MDENLGQIHMFPRIVRAAPKPLGLYIRPGRNDHRELINLIAAGKAACFGAVFDPTRTKRHGELLAQVLDHKLDAILDPKTQQSALPGSYSDELGGLPWGAGRPHVATDFIGTDGTQRLAKLADFIVKHGFTEAMAPSHLLGSADDEWLQIDVQSTAQLRKHLDQRGAKKIPLIYSLAIPYAAFRDHKQRQKIINTLESSPIDAIWLKIDGLGANGTSAAVRNYINGAADFHALSIPIVADHMGGLFGLSLLAFGAVSGLSHGVTLGERFDASSWRKAPEGHGFSPSHRIYIAELDLMLTRDDAEALLTAPGRARGHFGCRDTSCCPRGIRDLLENPGRHFLIQRIDEVAGLSRVPERLRTQQFLDQRLRPATDRALAAATIKWESETMAKKTRENRKRLDSLRIALGDLAANSKSRSFALLPETRAVRDTHAQIG